MVRWPMSQVASETLFREYRTPGPPSKDHFTVIN